jgi:hypothetical protein
MNDRGHIAFKVTFNDMNWQHVCSPSLYKLNSKKVTFCKENKCQLYLNRELTNPPCNDCVANRDLKFGPGGYLTGDKPHICKKTKVGDIAFLTSKKPKAAQNERFIFTIYKIKSIVDVDEYLENSSKYYIGDKYSAIYLDTSQYIKFWNYYNNNLSNKKFSNFWGAGLFRYMGNEATESILKEVIDNPIFYPEQKANAKYFLQSIL